MFACACTLLAITSYGQLTPAPSSTQVITQNLGLGKMTLTYSRPNVRGRKIFGVTEPYNTIWRTGANSATTIIFTDDVTIEGHKVAAGTYGLFSIPGMDKWTMILSKNSKQWGAYAYKESDDYLRFNITPEKLSDNVETLTMQFTDVFPTTANLRIKWEHTGLLMHLTTDIDAQVMANIDSAMQTDKKPYYDAVIYYYNNNKDMNKALVWATELEKDPAFPPMVPKLWKARVLLKKGDKTGAIVTAREGLKAAEAAKSDEYMRLNKEVIAQAEK